jgi:hypothetical protein
MNMLVKLLASSERNGSPDDQQHPVGHQAPHALELLDAPQQGHPLPHDLDDLRLAPVVVERHDPGLPRQHRLFARAGQVPEDRHELDQDEDDREDDLGRRAERAHDR